MKYAIIDDYFAAGFPESETISPQIKELLFSIPFLIHDQNRIQDVMEYLITWVNQNEIRYSERAIDHLLESDISVWEILYVLACRLSNEYMNVEPGFLIEQFIKNLGENPKNKRSIQLEFLIEQWQNGHIESDGSGSIFRLNHPKRGFKNLDLWNQALIFISDLSENVTF